MRAPRFSLRMLRAGSAGLLALTLVCSFLLAPDAGAVRNGLLTRNGEGVIFSISTLKVRRTRYSDFEQHATAFNAKYPRCLVTASHALNPLETYYVLSNHNTTELTFRQASKQIVADRRVLVTEDSPWVDIGVAWVANHRPLGNEIVLPLSKYKPGTIEKASDLGLASINKNTATGGVRSVLLTGYGADRTTRFTVTENGVPFMREENRGQGERRYAFARATAYYAGDQNNNDKAGGVFRVNVSRGRGATNSLYCNWDSGSPLMSFSNGKADYGKFYGVQSAAIPLAYGPLSGGAPADNMCRDHRANLVSAFDSRANNTGNYEKLNSAIERACAQGLRIERRRQGKVSATISPAQSYVGEALSELNNEIDCGDGVVGDQDFYELVHYGQGMELEATPAYGYEFKRWLSGESHCPCEGSTSSTCEADSENIGTYTTRLSIDESVCVAVFAPLTCGDGNVDADEDCDDAGASATCTADCTVPACGDRRVDAASGETCDDGNTTSGDGCSGTCDIEEAYCGNDVVDEGEECDMPPWLPLDDETSDTCSATCTITTCGDGTVDMVEQCDDGDTENGDGCSESCEVEVCGNRTVDEGEQCDDGNTDDDDGCSATCAYEYCGNGIVEGDEECDDDNGDDGDGCSDICRTEDETCGDGNVETGESCDDGPDGSEECDADCTVPACGDGVLNEPAGEECDDGDTENGDGCSDECEWEWNVCGNGTVDDGEVCDDGNGDDGDGCYQCFVEECGNGVEQADEECDDGNEENGDGCSATCTIESSSSSSSSAASSTHNSQSEG
jgi:cysteine-rich repeat protein